MLLTAKGLVLREVAYGEADKMIDLLTADGILAVCARGSRKANSKYGAITQSFSYGEFCLRESKGRYALDSAVPIAMFYGIRTDLFALALAAYFSELTRRISTAQPQPQILRLFLNCLHYLAEHTRPLPQLKCIFELRLLVEMGMMPNLLCCPLCGAFLPSKPVLRIAHGDFFCKDCLIHNSPRDLLVTPAVLQAARHILFADFDRLFHFRLGEESQRLLAEYTEQSVLQRLEFSCKTLQFYQSLTAGDAPLPDQAEG